MSKICIVSAPPGEAPEHIRQAWIGCSLPLLEGSGTEPMRCPGVGVLTGPKSFIGLWIASTFGRCEEWQGYKVDAVTAIKILALKHPEAARWWREETPHMITRERVFIFPADNCQLEQENEI